jgi:hypothetical protein
VNHLLSIATGIALVITTVAPAAARTQTTVGYPADRVFTAAVRFVRLDLDFKIVDKDADAGFVVFEYKDDGKIYRGTFELIKVDKGSQALTLVAVDIADRPDYLEGVLIERFRRKLQVDLGDEPPAPPPAPPPTAPPPPAPPPTT